MKDQIRQFFAEDGPLAKRLSGYVPRPAQIEMALAVAGVLDQEKGRLIVEAGTGTGKSLAYLVAALLSEKRVMISTGTRTLQDQLFHKDLPLALDCVYELTKKRKRTLLMKGRANYLCLHRAENFSPTGDMFDAGVNRMLEQITDWSGKTMTGDRAELAGLPDDALIWSELNARGEICLGQECKLYQDCFVTQMRKSALGADVIVVNHALLCADRTLRIKSASESAEGDGWSQIIPDTDLWIIDEAHSLEDNATKHFGVSLSLHQVKLLARDLLQIFLLLPAHEQASFRVALDEMSRTFLAILQNLIRLTRTDENRARIMLALQQPEIVELIGTFKESVRTILVCLVATRSAEGGKKAEISAMNRRVEKLLTDALFLFEDGAKQAGYVTFLEHDAREYTISAAPIDVAEVLRKNLWSGKNPIVFTSASLAVKNSLEPFVRKIGLFNDDKLQTQIWPAPFDFEQRSSLYVPPHFPEPSHESFAEHFEDEARFLARLSGGGTFLLFTSHRAMLQSYERLKPDFDDLGLQSFKQGDAPKLELLKAFVEADASDGGVLFATHSFWEGVDVRGKALRMVVIDKLPFRSPSDPIYQARMERLEEQKLSAFAHLSLPEAALALKQGVGRLLRSIEDAGVVAVLDSRLIHKNYGQVFLQTLPPMRRLHQRRQLEEFWLKNVLGHFKAVS